LNILDALEMDHCNKCGESLAYISVTRKNQKAKVKAICKNNHKHSFELQIEWDVSWIRKMAEHVFTCTECGGRTRGIGPEGVTEVGEDVKISIRCPSGCKDDERVVDKRLAIAIQRNVLRMKPFGTPFKPGAYPRGGVGVTSTERVEVSYRLPETCPRCKAPIISNEVHWIGPLEAKCPYCNHVLRAQEEEL